MYEFARGPLMWIAALVFTCGIIYRILQLFILTRKKERVFYNKGIGRKPVSDNLSTEEKKLGLLISFQNSLIGKHPIMAVVSTVFHVILFVVPVFALGHSLMLYESWGISFPSLPDALIDLLTIIFIASGLFFLMRRLFVDKVRAVTSLYDYVLLLVTAAPFLTGFFAYHQWFDYNTVLTIHILAGEAMLIAIPFTKLGHMIFFFFVRILIGSEYSFWRGNRTWAA